MSLKATLLASLVLAALVAGCAADPPKGGIQEASHAIPLSGGASVDYQPFEGGNAAGDAPAVGGQLRCAQGSVPGQPVPPCKGPWTDIRVNVTAPRAVEGTYAVYLVNATGEMLVVELAEGASAGSTALYTGAKNFTEDFTDRFTGLELRLGGFLLATAPVTEGSPAFALAPAAMRLDVDATWEGRTITGTVTGLPPNATYRGNLYLAGADGAVEAEPAESFEIDADGSFSHTSTTRDISAFAEFHIHVGQSKINLYKATIQTTEE